MKKFMFFAALAAVCFWACDPQNDPTPTPQSEDPVEGTSDWSVIGTVLGSNWDKDYVMAASGDVFVLKNLKLAKDTQFKIRYQKGWDNNRGGAFAKLGEGFAVTNGGDNIVPGVEGFFDVYYNPAVEQMAVCEKDKNPQWQEKSYEAPITIDGDFADWAKLDASKIVSATCDPDAAKKALQSVKIYADDVALYIYFEFDATAITWELDVEHVPFHLYFDGDNNPETGGKIGDQWSETGFEVLFEGSLTDGNNLVSYDPGAYAWNGEPMANSWSWDVESPLAEGGMCTGAGKDNKYEIQMLRDLYPSADGLADPFVLGIDIQQAWSTVGYLPNTSAEAEKGPAFVIKANK